jgi:hypothetical protein
MLCIGGTPAVAADKQLSASVEGRGETFDDLGDDSGLVRDSAADRIDVICQVIVQASALHQIAVQPPSTTSV